MNGSLHKMAVLAFRYSFYFAVTALVVLFFYSAGSAGDFGKFLAIFGILVSLALGSAAAGGIVGFLFGIPHTLQSGASPQPPPTPVTPVPATPTPGAGTGVVPTTPGMAPIVPATPAAAPAAPVPAAVPTPTPTSSSTVARNTNYGRSTNLEQIADWLTKIIVGVGLVEIHKIVRIAANLCTYVGSSLDGNGMHNGSVIAGSVMIAFLVTGFLIAYLWTYLYLLEIQDHMNVSQQIQNTVNATLENNDARNKLATDTANTQLNLPENATDIPISQLVEVLRGASKNVCSMIFFHAVAQRKQCFIKPELQFRVARTIPIFKALITLDEYFEYPENYLQLGYALKDKKEPDYAQALQNIDKAISNFDRADGRMVDVALAYFNRAYCRIKLEQIANPQQPSAAALAQLIRGDLAFAGQDTAVQEVINSNEDVVQWKVLNP